MFEATNAAAGDRADASVQDLMDKSAESEGAVASAGGSNLPDVTADEQGLNKLHPIRCQD